VNDSSSRVVQLPSYALRPSTVSAAGAAPGGCVNCGQPLTPLTSAGDAPAAVQMARAGGFVYGVGRLNARFPSLGAEKEYAQLADGDPDAIVRTTDLKETLSKEQNRYLARQICWVFSGPGGDSFLVVPRDGDDLNELLDALSSDDSTVHVVVGSAALSTPGFGQCLSSGLPAVHPDQLLVFSRDSFLGALPEPGKDTSVKSNDTDAWKRTAASLFDHLTQRTDNHGLSDQHRALNYLALRYPAIYQLAFNEQAGGAPLIGVDARPAQIGGRRIIEIRFAFRHTQTHVVRRYICRVDVTDLFPFLTSSLTLTFD
jgi:hypothetical protein